MKKTRIIMAAVLAVGLLVASCDLGFGTSGWSKDSAPTAQPQETETVSDSSVTEPPAEEAPADQVEEPAPAPSGEIEIPVEFY